MPDPSARDVLRDRPDVGLSAELARCRIGDGSNGGNLPGALQVASGNPSGRWYLYRDTNIGAAVGFFANANHMAMLLVVSLPFLAALGSDERGREGQRYWGLLAILGGVVTVLIAGILLNGSLAGLALTLPVLLASAAIMLSASGRLRRGLLLAAGGLLALAIAAIANSSIGPAKIDLGARTSVASRAEIFRTTGSAIGDFMPFGSGLGTFAKVYPLYESPDLVTSEFVVHAHNDYAEVALELGIPGVLLVIAFLGWWLTLVRRAWDQGDAYARAASVASAAILCHSLVDFPLRTAAMAAVFATCMGLLVDRRQQRVPAMISRAAAGPSYRRRLGRNLHASLSQDGPHHGDAVVAPGQAVRRAIADDQPRCTACTRGCAVVDRVRTRVAAGRSPRCAHGCGCSRSSCGTRRSTSPSSTGPIAASNMARA